VRFLTSSETSDGHSLDEGVVKRVTGQSPVRARHIRSNPITFLPEFKTSLIFLTRAYIQIEITSVTSVTR
jgi:phage/plasmid-associated DNA primase